MKRQVGFWTLSVTTLILATAALAQYPAQPKPAPAVQAAVDKEAASDDGTLTVQGCATLRLKPELLRMQVQICARAATLDEALDRLKTRREAAMKKLAKLGVEKDAIEVGAICLSKMNSTIGYATPYSTYPPATNSTSAYAPSPATNWTSPPPSSAPSLNPGSPIHNAAPPENYSPPSTGPLTPDDNNDADANTPNATPPGAYPPPTAPPTTTASNPPVAGSGGAVYVPRGPASVSGPTLPPNPVRLNSPIPVPMPPKPYVTVMESVTADWKLSGETQEDILKESEKLKDKIEEADLPGLKSDEKLPPEEETLRLNVVMMPYYPTSGVSTIEPTNALLSPPGMSFPTSTAFTVVNCEPKYLFVARLSEKQGKTLEAQAFAKAKSQAESLTEAAGCKLGAILTFKLDRQQPLVGPPTIFYGEVESTDGWYSLEEGKSHEKEIQSYTTSNLYSIFGVVVKYRLQ